MSIPSVKRSTIPVLSRAKQTQQKNKKRVMCIHAKEITYPQVEQPVWKTLSEKSNICETYERYNKIT
jgi:hypothetical protein